LFSEPTLLATSVIRADGTFAADIAVDQSIIAPGEHTLQIQAIGPDGYIKAANLGVTVAGEEPPFSLAGAMALGGLFLIVALAILIMVVALRKRRSPAGV